MAEESITTFKNPTKFLHEGFSYMSIIKEFLSLGFSNVGKTGEIVRDLPNIYLREMKLKFSLNFVFRNEK